MTSIRHYHGLEELLDRLESVQARRRAVAVGTAALVAATVVLGSLLAAAAASGYWPGQPPAGLRWTLLAVCVAVWAAALAWPAVSAVWNRQNAAQTARFIEQANPAVRNDLINALLLADDHAQVSPVLVQLAIRESVMRARRANLPKVVTLRRLRRWAVAAGVAVVAVAGFAAIQPAALRRGLAAVLNPTGYVPTANGIRLLSLTPGDTTIFAGQDVTIALQVADARAGGLEAAVILDGRDGPLAMAAGQDGAFSLTLPRLDGSVRYAVTADQSRWPNDRPFYTITVLAGAAVEGFSIQYDYPAYTGLASRTVEHADGPIEAPVGSRATVRLTVSQAPGQAALEVKDGAATPMSPSPDGKTFTGSLPVEATSAYRIVLRDPRGAIVQTLPDSAAARLADMSGPAAETLLEGYFPIRALADRPPVVEFLAPNRDVSLPPGAALALKIKVADDYGLTAAAVLAGKEGQPARAVADFPVAGRGQAVLDHVLTLDRSLRDGDAWVYFAIATDNRRCPGVGQEQTSTSGTFKIIVSAAAQAADAAGLQQALRDRLLAILRLQEAQRVATEVCRRTLTTAAAVSAEGTKIAAGQRSIRDELAGLTERFLWTAELTTVKTAVAELAANEAPLAVEQAKVVAALATLDGREEACAALAGTQNRILRQLQALLAILPTLQSPQVATSRGGGDLPPDAREKLQKLADQLEALVAAQHKVIADSAPLAKKPLDAFTPEDERLLAELRAVQDEWDKFLSEAFVDFSKLVQQDFSNPVLLQELISVKCDVTMAADALSAKAVEVATALEDNGIENAKTLTANIEKWLSDEPDRQQWSMEDPVSGQLLTEQAELPSELEDLMGDLLEQEEDLFGEMEDLTSKYAASLDLGAGWDAMDGPISSMNAQGVTGNRLPNTSELGGRSGEGRTGKSSGEYVEDKAVGKGGRRTPTRLGNEPFQAGQVNDQSAEPPGGATGGGKVSGAGAEGLEGPVPPPLAEGMQRLAGQQAAIVNRAERMQAAFRPGDYSHFKFLQAITLMNRVQNDLAANRYGNVLRARHVTLETVRQTRAALGGELVVETDTAAAMPKYVRDRLADAISGPMPEEYRDVLEQYYRRLAEQAGE